MSFRILISFAIFLLLSACTASSAIPPMSAAMSTAQPTARATSSLPTVVRTASVPTQAEDTRVPNQASETPVTITSTSTPAVQPSSTLGPDGWKELPIIPQPGDRVVEIYQRGLQLGNNPYAFSKVGDCGSTPAWFLGDFDRGEEFYDLGEYQNLESAILAYQGSFERTSLAARSGFNASSLLTTLWTDLESCEVTETPLECEYRVHKPVIAFITLGTNDIWLPEQFEPQMRKIIEYSIDQGVIPILATKADNEEGDGSINATIAQLAQEYGLPLWNYWLAVQPLPNHGLQGDQAHLTWGRNFFNVPENLTKAWPVRNLTALQVLYEVWMKVSGQTG